MSREGSLLSALFGLGLAACTTTTDFTSLFHDLPRAESLPPPIAEACVNLDFGGIEGTVLEGASQPGGQNVPAGMTPSASTILVQRGGCSTNLALLIADEIPAGSGHYTSLPISPFAWMDTSSEEGVTLTADGLTLIGLRTKDDGFLEATRSAVGKVDFTTPSAGPFAGIMAMGRQTFWAPVLSADGLAFYYVVQKGPDPAVNGIYESLRATTAVPFPAGTRMPAAVQDVAQYVNAVSGDHLSIFLEARSVWQTLVFSRARVSDEFTNPLAPNDPPTVPGLRTRPVSGCRRVIGSCAPSGSGCTGERICAWTR